MLNPGAWTHYSYAIRDALELAGLPAVEVHLSDVDSREEWRRRSVITELCIARVAGKGPDGYREALERVRDGARVVSARADRPRRRRRCPDAGVDVLLVGRPINVRYLTGYTGSNGIALVGPGRADVRDRFPLRRAGSGGGRPGVRPPPRRAAPARGRWRTRCRRASCALGFEAAHMSVSEHARLRELLPARIELVGTAGSSSNCGRSRSPTRWRRSGRQRRSRTRHSRQLVAGGLAGRNERELATALEFEMRRRGARRPSFEPIVAAGPNGALPHAGRETQRWAAASSS